MKHHIPVTYERDGLDADEPQKHRQSRVINRDYVKRWALDYAKDKNKNLGRFERVSERFLNAVEADCKAFIRHRVDSHPSRGKTLM